MSENAPPDFYLQPGDFEFGEAPGVMRTLLGSCVTVTLWHPVRHIGGMCHFMLPNRKREPKAPLDGRYADEAFALFDRAIARTGTRPGEYIAKLFGGGNMFTGKLASGDLGNQNIAAARSLMKERGIAVAAEHVGGSGHRKLIFDLSSGEVRLSHQELATS